jgi:GNAT superfamily N-acetyltransferase
MTSLEIVRRRPEHDPELFALYAEVFGDGNLERSRRRYEWQYFENPNTPSDGPVIWTAREGDTLLGQMATMPLPMWWGDREVRASAGNDYFVRKSAQGRGIGIALSNRWADEDDVALALGLTPSSYPLFRKLFTDVGPVPSYLKILDATAVAKKKWGTVAGAVAGPLLGLGLSLISRSPGQAKDVEVQPVEAFSDEYDDLWLKARASFATCVRRDARYLRWKFLACPFRAYRVLEARKSGALSGYAVLRDEGDAAFTRGVIADLFCDTTDIATQDALIAAAISDFSTKRRVRIEVYCFNQRLARAFRRHGFGPGTTAVQYCIAYRGTPDGKAGTRTVLDQLDNWNLFIGDGDLDRA